MSAAKFWRSLNRLHDLFLLLGFIVLMLISNYCVYDSYYIFTHAEDDDITRYKPTVSGYDPDASPLSQDMAGWLTIDGTNIDYPVMYSTDSGKYLNTDPYGNYSLSGSIFLDSENSPDMTDDYLLIYGHHMEYGKMFGALDDFVDEGYLASHKRGTLIVGRDGRQVYELQVIAAAKVDAKEDTVFRVSRSGDIARFISENADVKTAEPHGRIAALATCAENRSTMRVVVFCNIIE
ncbi:class B sortase [Ruminococcus sp.]|uniref:class B sortase n=1 Tax=Ruminococcus sp. TaxID=41978 RepID=UPI0025EDED0D|nr:class B sortase [Ruminococcus sp.]MBQ8966611.1 class B sortase [Ruminococcus sp.]